MQTPSFTENFLSDYPIRDYFKSEKMEEHTQNGDQPAKLENLVSQENVENYLYKTPEQKEQL